jgi:hypothetical protein
MDVFTWATKAEDTRWEAGSRCLSRGRRGDMADMGEQENINIGTAATTETEGVPPIIIGGKDGATANISIFTTVFRPKFFGETPRRVSHIFG